MKRKYALDANLIFLLSIIASQVLTPTVCVLGVKDAMMLQILIEFFLLLPGIVYLIMQKRPLKESLGLNALTWKQWLLLIPLAICMVNITEFVNLISQLFVTNQVSGHMLDLTLQYPFPVAFFAVAIMPMICEEVIFRGIIYQGYRRSGILRAILLSSFLFGIMHMNLNQFSYAFVLGILFCLINEAAGSFLPSMVMHLFINGRSIVLLYGVVELLEYLHNRYVAAKAAGDTMMMELLEKATAGIPIESENWLEAYMSIGAEDMDMAGTILGMIPGVLISVIGVVLIIRYFLKSTGRTEHFKSIFRRKERREGEEIASEKISVVSVSLLIGCAICFYFMLAEFIPI
ncbi:MAG: CPBP family intramembrane metalloprotease [Lachnospiraceae bacterium]|nr:CPBP family intramembrane metalloprotease [Lachnospiraceae bacterium]